MIAMCYLIIYMLNEAQLPGVSTTDETDRHKCFVEVRNAKNQYSLDSLCQGRAQLMKDILPEVFALGFKDKPNYDHLKEMFQQQIDDIKLRYAYNQVPQFEELMIPRPSHSSSSVEAIMKSANKILPAQIACVKPSISDEFLLSVMKMNKNNEMMSESTSANTFEYRTIAEDKTPDELY